MGRASNKSDALEAGRRADIVRRYVAVDRPTQADDDRFAAELGLTVDSLYRFARVWRLGGTVPAANAGRTQARQDRIDALLAAQEPDLTSISPAKRGQVIQRIGAIRSYLEIERPTGEDLRLSASSLDLHPEAFRRLLRSWLAYRDPAALPGAATALRKVRRKAPTIDPAAERHLADAIAELGARATSLDVHRLAESRCRRDGLRPPSRTTVYHRVMHARAEVPENGAALAIAVDHVAIALAVVGEAGPQMPVLSFAFQPSGRITAHALSLDPPTAHSTAQLLSSILDGPVGSGTAIPLRMECPAGAEWTDLISVLKGSGVVLKRSRTRRLGAGRSAGRAFGDVIGRLRLRPRHALNPKAAPLKGVMGCAMPLTLPEAEAAVADAIRAHNESRTEEPSASFVRADRLDELAAGLVRIAQGSSNGSQ